MPDREIITNDKKNQVLHFNESPYTDERLPVVNVHDDPVQYHKINPEWRAIIFGWLHILASVRGFKDATEEDHPGIQNVLQFLEPVPANEIKYPVSAFEDCVEFGTFNDATQYTPNNPFAPNEPYEKSLLELKWARFGDIISPGFLPDWLQLAIDTLGEQAGYLSDDIFLVLDNRDLFGWNTLSELLTSITSLNIFPSITVTLDGAGIVQLKFLNVPFGGSVLIWWDIEPTFEQVIDIVFGGELFTNFVLAELHRDLLAFPPETISTRIVEIVLEDEGMHEIKCIFMPTFNDELPFVFPFGGFRELQVCDGIEVIGVTSGTRTRPDIYRPGVIMSTSDDICNGVLCALGKAGLYISAGKNSDLGFTFDSNGQLIVDDGSGQGAITAIAQEQLNGSANQAFAGVNEFIEDFADFYTSTSQDAATMELFLSSKWLLNATITTAIADYITYRQIPQAAPDLLLDGLIEDFFCKGITKSTTAAWIIDTLAQNQALLLGMVQALSEDQYFKWISDGAQNPDGDYLGFDCYRRPVFEFDIPAEHVAYTNPAFHNAVFGLYNGISEDRNIKITVSGKFVAPSGEEFDILYWKDDEGALSLQQWQNFGMNQSGGNQEANNPPQQLPYSETGDYAWITQITGGRAYDTFLYRAPNLNDAWQPNVTGEIHVKIEDQGQVV